MTKQYTTDLARLCANLSSEDISPVVRERVRYLLLDHPAVTLRGSLLPSSPATYQMLYTVHGIHAEEVTISGGYERFANK
jgi:2-methylcitrate dehydratase PrpD